MKTAWLSCALIACSSAALAAEVGAAAPALGEDVKWLKGDPIPAFRPGSIYVLDLWGTWCPPCIVELPKLQALAEKYRGKVAVVAVAVYPQSGMPVKQFVDKQPDLMPYTVGEDIDNRIVKRFDDGLGGLGAGGFPLKAIIDRKGQVAFLGRGYPVSGFEETLKAVVEDRFDIAPKAAEHRRAVELKKRFESVIAEAEAKENAREYEAAQVSYRKLLDADPGLFALPAAGLYLGLRQHRNKDVANAWARELLEQRYKGEDQRYAWPLAQLAEGIVIKPRTQDKANDDATPADFELALKCARRSTALMKDRDAWRLQTLATILWAKGDRDEAISTIERAVRVGEEETWGAGELQKIVSQRNRYRPPQ